MPIWAYLSGKREALVVVNQQHLHFHRAEIFSFYQRDITSRLNPLSSSGPFFFAWKWGSRALLINVGFCSSIQSFVGYGWVRYVTCIKVNKIQGVSRNGTGVTLP
jgi:hypothetical protein